MYIGELFKLVRQKGYVTYADLCALTHTEGDLPDFYNHWGWTNLMDCKVKVVKSGGAILLLPQIKNIENKIKFVKENKNEQSISKNI